MRRKRVYLMAGALLAVLAAGCGKPTTACRAQENAVTICLNGKPLDFRAARNAPHAHEHGHIYAPAAVLGKQLKVDVRLKITPDGKSAIVTVGGRPFEPAMSHGSKGIHVHDGEVFVPVREFAKAAGLQIEMDVQQGWAGFSR